MSVTGRGSRYFPLSRGWTSERAGKRQTARSLFLMLCVSVKEPGPDCAQAAAVHKLYILYQARILLLYASAVPDKPLSLSLSLSVSVSLSYSTSQTHNGVPGSVWFQSSMFWFPEQLALISSPWTGPCRLAR